MRAARRIGPLLALGVVSLALPAMALAVPVSTAALVAVAEQHGMTCTLVSDGAQCTTGDSDPYLTVDASITSQADLVTGVLSRVLQAYSFPVPPDAEATTVALQTPACGDEGTMTKFVADVMNLATQGDALGPVAIGDCQVSGAYVLLGDTPAYLVGSTVTQPTPTPTATTAPTASLSPSVSATARASSSARPSVTQRPSRTPRPTHGGSPSPSPSASASSFAASPSIGPSPTLEQEVKGVQTTPRASPSPPAAPQAGSGTIGHSTLAATLVARAGVRLDPPALAGSAVLAVLLLLFMGFVGELFNSTLESNYDEVAGWLGIWRRRSARVLRFWSGRLGMGLFIALGALVYAVLDPAFGFDLESLSTFLGLLLGLLVVMLAFELPGLLMYRRRTGQLPGIRALPWTLPAALACVVISRLAALEPGYLYGLLLGLVFSHEPTPAEEGRQTAAGAAWTLGLSLAGWLILSWVRSDPAPFAPVAQQLTETALAVVVVGGLEAVAFGLLPMRFLAGAALYAWSRVAWAVLFGAGTFAFLYLLIGPHSGYLAELPLAGLLAAFGAFAAFGAISVLFWGYFRFRRPREEPAAP